MKTAFVSNYINHHQIPFCDEMYRLLEGEFTFVQTEPMEEERIRMGWHGEERPLYVKCWYEEPEDCRRLVMDCELVLFGGTDEESYIQERLQAGKPVIRLSERLYKTGQWKAVSPRGLRKKYIDHTRYRKVPVYLLCAGAYVPSDFHIVRAYPGKMYCWGYFPESREHDIENLLAAKGWETDFNYKAASPTGGRTAMEGTKTEKLPYLLWAGRMIDWKHPELALETAAYLKKQGLSFHLEMVGDGELRQQLEEQRKRGGLEEQVSFSGFLPPEEVRLRMERADIYLFTSDRKEGWGAVANEAMNSGCALVADHMIGSIPWLVAHGENGLVYQDGKASELFRMTESLVRDREACRRLGRNAYDTITETWNAKNAAESLIKLAKELFTGQGLMTQESKNRSDQFSGKGSGWFSRESLGQSSGKGAGQFSGKAFSDECFQGGLTPCSPAPLLTERKALMQVRRLADRSREEV